MLQTDMTDISQLKNMNPVLEKLDKLTYGLIYPAFLGNMIYDIIQGIAENGRLKGTELFIAIMIFVLNGLDYMHLYVDMRKIVDDKFDKIKGPVYIFCDIASSCFFFAAFLLLKYQHTFWTMILLGIIPALTAIYKQTYSAGEDDKRFATRYGIAFGLLTVIGACIFSCDCMIDQFLICFISLEVIVYFVYIFLLFPMYKSTNAVTSQEE
jgi:hypothetical protein